MTDLAANETPPLRLLHFRVSHFNEKVRWALDHKSWPHEREALIAGFHVPKVRGLTGQHELPVIVIDGRPIHDSTVIIEELERRRPRPALYPSAPDELERALAIEDYFDEQVAPDVRRLFWSTYLDDADACARMATDGFGATTRWTWRTLFVAMRPAFRRNMQIYPDEVAATLARLPQHLDRLEAEIGPSGYLVGDRFTVADLTAAAVMTAILRPPEFPYPLPTPWPSALVALRESIVARRASQWVLEMYRRHRGKHSPALAGTTG